VYITARLASRVSYKFLGVSNQLRIITKQRMYLVAVDVPFLTSQADRVQQYVTAISMHTFGCHIARTTAPSDKNGAGAMHCITEQ
jgi:hypothetical protein